RRVILGGRRVSDLRVAHVVVVKALDPIGPDDLSENRERVVARLVVRRVDVDAFQSLPPVGSRYRAPPGRRSHSGWRWTRCSCETGSFPSALDQTKKTFPQACTRTPTAAPARTQWPSGSNPLGGCRFALRSASGGPCPLGPCPCPQPPGARLSARRSSVDA